MKKNLIKIKACDAAGSILAHDMTRIVPGKDMSFERKIFPSC